LDATCLGQSIRRVIITDTRILAGVSASELAQRLEGARITESLRHGKHLLMHLGPPGLADCAFWYERLAQALRRWRG
jgi:formamidopyrimidine-DNA glycosylase